MPLKFPATFKDVSIIEGHPFYNPKIRLDSLVIFLNGEPKDEVITASATNGYIHVYAKDLDGRPMLHPKHPDRLLLKRLKGNVEIFYHQEE